MRYRLFSRLTATFLLLAGVSLPRESPAQTQPRSVWVISEVSAGVPHAPNGDMWNSTIGSLLSLNLKGVQPSVRICMESPRVPATCMPVCENAPWIDGGNAYVCTQPTGSRGLLLEKSLHVLVQEVSQRSPRVIADFKVDDPTKCQPCTLQLGGGPFWIRFKFAQVGSYTGPLGGTLGTIPPPSTLPTAAPSSGGSAPPPPAPAPAPSAAAVDSALSDLRDSDNCTGPDAYFPQGTVLTRSLLGQQLGQDQANQLYQMAAFAMAISDPAVKQLVLNNIRSRVGNDTFDGVMTLILADVAQSQALLSAFQDVVNSFATKIAQKGLSKFLPSFQPPSSLAPDVDRWILKKLTTDPLASRAVDLMFTDHKISAECALNQLAKEGFMETVGAQ